MKEKADEEKRAAKKAIAQKKVEQKPKATKRPKSVIPQSTVDLGDESCNEEVFKYSPQKKRYHQTKTYDRNSVPLRMETDNYSSQQIASANPSFSAESLRALEDKLSAKFEKQLEHTNKQTLGEIMQLKSLLIQHAANKETANSK
jgi:hypothetical protein